MNSQSVKRTAEYFRDPKMKRISLSPVSRALILFLARYPAMNCRAISDRPLSRTQLSEYITSIVFDAVLVEQFEKLLLKRSLSVMLLLISDVSNGPLHL